MFDVGLGAAVWLEKLFVAREEVRTLPRLGIDGADEKRISVLYDGVASLDGLHVRDHAPRSLVREGSDNENQNCRDQCQNATLCRTGKTETQAEAFSYDCTLLTTNNVGSCERQPIIGDFRASAVSDLA